MNILGYKPRLLVQSSWDKRYWLHKVPTMSRKCSVVKKTRAEFRFHYLVKAIGKFWSLIWGGSKIQVTPIFLHNTSQYSPYRLLYCGICLGEWYAPIQQEGDGAGNGAGGTGQQSDTACRVSADSEAGGRRVLPSTRQSKLSGNVLDASCVSHACSRNETVWMVCQCLLANLCCLLK